METKVLLEADRAQIDYPVFGPGRWSNISPDCVIYDDHLSSKIWVLAREKPKMVNNRMVSH